MTYLLASILALAFGPLVHKSAERMRGALAGLDGFVFVAVSGLVLFKLMPLSIAGAGWGAGAALAIGFFALNVVERLAAHRGTGELARRVRALGLIVAAAGVALHELLDGVALATAAVSDPGGHVLPAAIILHRLPIGMALWWLIRPGYGRAAAWCALAGVAVATGAGYAMGQSVAALGDGHAVALLQGLVSGSLLHLALHRSEPVAHAVETPRDRLAAGIGALLALALVAAMRETDIALPGVPGELGAEPALIALAAMVAPWFAGAALLTAILHWTTPIPALAAAQRGPARMIDAWRRLAETAPVQALATLVAVPLLGLEALMLSVPLLGDQLALARMVTGVAIAAAVAIALAPRPAPATDAQLPPVRLVELADHLGPWLVVGLAIAAIAEPFVDPALFEGIPVWAQILGAAALAAPVYMPTIAALPVAALLVHKGLSPGAALAFLVVGPVLHRRVLAAILSLHGARVCAGFVALVTGGALTAGFAADRLLDIDPLALHAAAARGPTIAEWIGLGITGALLALALVRQGPRGFLEQVMPSVHEHDHHHHNH